MEKYGLDLAHYYTAGLTWDVLLKKTGIELELLTDLDMYLFIESGTSMESKKLCESQQPVGSRL